MNQKYLQGLASDMAGASSAVFFEATPENIAAFLMQHQAADLSAIGTADGRTFLTARTGFIDVCPDQEYLIKTLLPIYSKVQMGIAPVPPLKTVPKSVAASEECPRPDWNYLRWEGCSDQKYQDILSGKFLLGLPGQEETVSMEVQVRSYFNACKLALELVDWSSGEPESWGHLTVNLGIPMEKDCAFVDVNNFGTGILAWIEKNGLGKPTGRIHRSGFVEYPEYRFDAGRLKELDEYGYQKHSQRYDVANRPPHQKKNGQER